MFHNNKDGTFTEVAQKIGLGKAGKGLGITIADYDRDGHIDLLPAKGGKSPGWQRVIE